MFGDIPGFFARIINAIWLFFTSEAGINKLAEYINTLAPSGSPLSGFIECSGAIINLCVPIRHIGIMLAMKLPILFLATILSLIYRGKSFIPTMGD